jgi:hypothetical protein
MDAQKNCIATFPRDRIGKVFIVFVNGTRRCLVCERLFTRDAAREHCDVPCDPVLPDSWLLKNFSVLILPLSTGA